MNVRQVKPAINVLKAVRDSGQIPPNISREELDRALIGLESGTADAKVSKRSPARRVKAYYRIARRLYLAYCLIHGEGGSTGWSPEDKPHQGDAYREVMTICIKPNPTLPYKDTLLEPALNVKNQYPVTHHLKQQQQEKTTTTTK